MKKLFAIVAVATLLFACSDEKGNDNNPNNQGGPSSDYTMPISIDGNFADWDALDAGKVAVATLPEGPVKYDALKTLKVYADEYFIYAYIEFDDTALVDKEMVPTHFYINTDNNPLTGGGDALWIDCDADHLFEGFIYDQGSMCSYDPNVYAWHGFDNEPDWLWGAEEEAVLFSGVGMSKGAAKVDENGVGAYEFSFIIDLLPFELADTFTVGVGIQQNWDSVGMLPCNLTSTDDPEGSAEKLVVTIDK